MNKEEVMNAQTQEQTRQYAIDWQFWMSGKSMSWGEVAEWGDIFSTLADKFDLVEEFHENGII